MSLVLELPQRLEAKREEEARRAGMPANESAIALIRRGIDTPPIDAEEQRRQNESSIALLQSWLEAAKKPRSDEERPAAEAEMTDLRQRLNASRKESGHIGPFGL